MTEEEADRGIISDDVVVDEDDEDVLMQGRGGFIAGDSWLLLWEGFSRSGGDGWMEGVRGKFAAGNGGFGLEVGAVAAGRMGRFLFLFKKANIAS